MKKVILLILLASTIISVSSCTTSKNVMDDGSPVIDENMNSKGNEEHQQTENEDLDSEVADEEKEAIEEKKAFILDADEKGEYGFTVTFNKGTADEITFMAYHIPAGTYTVTNKGEYMSQISVYSDETHITEDGWEEAAETVAVKLIDVDKSETLTVSDGQYVKIVSPSKFEFSLQ